MEERKKGLRNFTLEMEESSEKKIRLLYLYLLREEGNERFFSLSLSLQLLQLFLVSLAEDEEEERKMLLSFSFSPSPPSSSR